MKTAEQEVRALAEHLRKQGCGMMTRQAMAIDLLLRAEADERQRCADIADNMIRACITDDERDIATTIRNLILAPSILCGDGTPCDPGAPYPAGDTLSGGE